MKATATDYEFYRASATQAWKMSSPSRASLLGFLGYKMPEDVEARWKRLEQEGGPAAKYLIERLLRGSLGIATLWDACPNRVAGFAGKEEWEAIARLSKSERVILFGECPFVVADKAATYQQTYSRDLVKSPAKGIYKMWDIVPNS